MYSMCPTAVKTESMCAGQRLAGSSEEVKQDNSSVQVDAGCDMCGM